MGPSEAGARLAHSSVAFSLLSFQLLADWDRPPPREAGCLPAACFFPPRSGGAKANSRVSRSFCEVFILISRSGAAVVMCKRSRQLGGAFDCSVALSLLFSIAKCL